MNSNGLNELGSQNSGSSESPSSRCTKASPQLVNQMQGGINSRHQGHTLTSLTAQNNQPIDSLTCNCGLGPSSNTTDILVATTLDSQSESLVDRAASSTDKRESSHSSSSKSSSCGTIVIQTCQPDCKSEISQSSSSSSASLVTQAQHRKQVQQKQPSHAHNASSCRTNDSKSCQCSSIRSSVHCFTPSVPLGHLSQVPNQSFSSPSLVQSSHSIDPEDRTNSCQFISSSITNSHPIVSSSSPTVVSAASARENTGASAHSTQVKEGITSGSIINSANSSVDVPDMLPQSSGTESRTSGLNSLQSIPTVDCTITKNHSDSTQRNAAHQSSNQVECVDSCALSTLRSQDESHSAVASPVHSSEVLSASKQTTSCKQCLKRLKGSHTGTDDEASSETSDDSGRESATGASSTSSSTRTPVEGATMAPNDSEQAKPCKVTTPKASTAVTSYSSPSHASKSASFKNVRTPSTPDDCLEYCWQSGMRSMRERLKAILNKETLADVHFLVGTSGNSAIFPAHKFVLSIGSPVFDAMFNRSFCEESDPYKLPDCEPCAFLALLTFLYTDEVTVDANSVMSTLYISKKYGVSELETQCVEFLREHLAPNNSIVLLSQARLFDEFDLAQNCLEYIDKSTIACLGSEGFTDIDRDTLSAILERDSLEIPEVTLWKCVVAWAKAECQRQQLDTSAENISTVLGPVINLIRFPLMSIEEFASEVAQTGVLQDKQIIDMFLYFTVNPKPQLPFSSATRGKNCGKERVVQRFQKVEYRWGYSGTSDRIRFCVNRRILLVGFGLFGAIHSSSEYDVFMQLLLPNGETLASNETCFTCDGSTQTFRVNFRQPVEIQPDVFYTACATMRGVDSYYGSQGKSVVIIQTDNESRVTFSFNYSSGCNNGTSVEDGQIPELYFII